MHADFVLARCPELSQHLSLNSNTLGGLNPIRFGNGLYQGSGSIRSIDRSIELFVVFAGWSFGRSSVLATVVWFWSQSSARYRSGASLGREDVRKEG